MTAPRALMCGIVFCVAARAGAGAPQLAIQTGHLAALTSASWSPDGKYLATLGSADGDGSVMVWDPASGRLLATIHPAALSGMRWSPDGRRIVAWEQSGAVHVWNARTGAIDATFTPGAAIRDLAWSPDGSRVVVAFRLTAAVVETQTWTIAATIPRPAAPLRFSPDGARLLAGGVVWDGRGETPLAKLDGFKTNLLRLEPMAWSPDGRLIAAASADRLLLWSVDGRRLEALEVKEGVRTIAWSPDGARFAAGSLATRIYRVAPAGSPAIVLEKELSGPKAWVEDLAWSNDGARLAAGTAEGVVAIWSSPGFEVVASVRAHEKNVAGTAWSPRSNFLATASLDASAKVWTREGGAVATMTAHVRGQLAVKWSPDSRFIAAGADDGPVRVWECGSGQVIASLEGEKAIDRTLAELWKAPELTSMFVKPVAVHRVRALEWSAAGDRLAVLATNSSTKIEVWDPLQNRRLSDFDLEVRDVRAFAWSRDGRRFAVGGRATLPDTRATRIIDAKSGEEAGFIGDSVAVNGDVTVSSLSWAAEGMTLARAGRNLSSLLVDLQTKKGRGEPVSRGCVAFSPDGTKLAAGGAVWDMATSRTLASTAAGDARAIAWSPDSRLLAFSEYKSAVIHDTTSGRDLAELKGHTRDVTGISWSQDGAYLVTSSEDGSLRLWSSGGEHLATLLILDEGREWLITTPEGLFDGSPAAWQLVGWHDDPEDYLAVDPVEIFFREYFHPGLLPEILGGGRPKPPRAIESIDRRQPVVKLSSTVGATADARTVEIRVTVRETPGAGGKRGSGAKDVRLFRNGTLAALWSGDVLKGKSEAVLAASVPIVAGENRLTAYAFNGEDIKSADAVLTVRGSEKLARRGVMRIIAIGVNRYANEDFELRFARADAEAFAGELRARQLRLEAFEKVDLVQLFDEQATRQAILGAIAAAGAATGPEDALVVFFAGHGIAIGPRFHLIPHDLGYSGPRSALDSTARKALAKHSISDLDLAAVFEKISAERILLVIDACNSGQALESAEKRLGPMNSRGLAQLAWEKGMNIITAAQGYQAALEAAELGHGYLTFVLVEEGLKKGAADSSPRDGRIVVREWMDFAAQRVPQLQADAMADARAAGREVVFVDGEERIADISRRSLQRPRVFYRREPEHEPLVIAKP